MRILIGCEFSGRVRDAFIAKGHTAVSCDLLPSETPGPHIQGDILKILDDSWDMLIAFPPCTYLTRAGAAYFNISKYGEKAKLRHNLREDAFDFFNRLHLCNINKICIENPIGYVNMFKKPTQIIQPWMFGHPESKATCLWLKNLPKLKSTNIVKAEVKYITYKSGRKRPFGPAQNLSYDSKIRSLTYLGIAKAMADQWG